MIDVHFMIYLGVLGVVLVCALVLAVLMVLVFAVAASVVSVRGRGKAAVQPNASGGQAWFWRQERRPARVRPDAGPAQAPGSNSHLPPAGDRHAGRGRHYGNLRT
ncbi:hypothetical protein J2S90_001622 [Arthrobacter bambusae]|uniref:Uncharacterized protein n=1 Tax=Arthrobacter bambusae TaxID=1338426 RepID=A0AAW8DG89_9MICC|nr:hypothetical protein [Arthrobacter bambusae]MDQ0129483.1 hypothetical protein [Arthrobacter bambusae]MDQ0180904.1 hypothetical protein [Arthrobacter bambusae]